MARTHFADACAFLWSAGELVHLEDLVLHDAGMDIRAPTHELTRAHAVLRMRRAIAAAAPDWPLTHAGLASLTGQGRPDDLAISASSIDKTPAGTPATAADGGSLDDLFASIDAAISKAERTLAGAPREPPSKPVRDPLIHDPDWDEDRRLSAWQSVIGQTRTLPPVLAAAIALDAWDSLQPLQHMPWLGRLLASSLLRERGKTRAHLACLYVGLKALPPSQRRRAGHDGLALSIAAMSAAAETGLKDHDRWLTAHTLLMRKLQHRRSTSHLPALVALVMARPIVSTAMIAAELKISQRAAQSLIDQLALRELTGRGRYRAWGIV